MSIIQFGTTHYAVYMSWVWRLTDVADVCLSAAPLSACCSAKWDWNQSQNTVANLFIDLSDYYSEFLSQHFSECDYFLIVN